MVFVIAITTVIAGCGSSGSSSGPVPENSRNVARYTGEQIVAALNLTTDPNQGGPRVTNDPAEGLWDPTTGCTVDVVMTTPAEVETYAGAGDPVATNLSRTVGVKYNGYQDTNLSGCYRIFTDRLRKLK